MLKMPIVTPALLETAPANTRSGDWKASAGGKSMGGGSGPIGGGPHLHLRRQGVLDQPIGLAVVQEAGHRVLAVTHELDGEVEAVRGRIDGRDVEAVAIARNRKGRNAGLGREPSAVLPIRIRSVCKRPAATSGNFTHKI
jgi:hypothetical protein